MVYNMDGYHGTIKPYADSILFSQRFRRSKKPNEWLGYGIYFYSHYEEADWWAHNQSRRHHNQPSILRASLECDVTEFFDLDLFNNVCDVNRNFITFMNDLKKEGTVGIDFESQKIDEQRCFAIELYKETHPEIKLIAYTFDAPISKKKASKWPIFVPRQKQYCVISHDVIKNICDVTNNT